jgi:hypothetical protein
VSDFPSFIVEPPLFVELTTQVADHCGLRVGKADVSGCRLKALVPGKVLDIAKGATVTGAILC